MTEIDTNIVVTLITCPAEPAPGLATKLIEERLAACVNIIPAVESVYRWQGKIETGTESLLMVKTTRAVIERLVERVKELHPYSCPEIITLPVTGGLGEYLSWVASETGISDKQADE